MQSDRRDFLKTAGAAGAGVAVASTAEESLAAGLEVDSFARHLDSEFIFSLAGDTYFKAKLLEASASDTAGAPGHRQPFSLIFTAPKDLNVSQDMYAVNHPKLGKMKLHVVPVDGTANETRLEAVFG